ncbi:hypothetical protein [Nitrosopumilus spindle-shaped virus]|uniref:Uncharacterized protein n=1 Tax=Nitrosopumilus spindle-shaped virus TaxID=2508184 RepID=A0A514K3A7_9VIRU|nr:hypothetical protein [Nitrosopumilus spindle-shaped virus]
MIDNNDGYPKVYSKDKTFYLEFHTKINLVYCCKSQGNEVIEIYSIDEIKNHIEDFKRNV